MHNMLLVGPALCPLSDVSFLNSAPFTSKKVSEIHTNFVLGRLILLDKFCTGVDDILMISVQI